MVEVVFKYRDALSDWGWREQACIVRDVEECKKIYGLGIDCEYEILKVKEIAKNG